MNPAACRVRKGRSLPYLAAILRRNHGQAAAQQHETHQPLVELPQNPAKFTNVSNMRLFISIDK
jgi:phage tail protein X